MLLLLTWKFRTKNWTKKGKKVLMIGEHGIHSKLLKEIATQRETFKNDIDEHFDRLATDTTHSKKSWTKRARNFNKQENILLRKRKKQTL